MSKTHKKNTVRNVLLEHINNNLKEYVIVILIFLIGIILGVVFINNVSDNQKEEISQYITSFITSLNENNTIDQSQLLKDSMIENTLLAISLWFIGSTVVGIPIVYGIIGFRGFCLGYTISSSIAVLGAGKGSLFVGVTILFQNILFIPCILALAVSGVKLYKSIMKDKRKENIKLEIYRHTIFSIIIAVLMILSAFIEVYVSSNLLGLCVKFMK